MGVDTFPLWIFFGSSLLNQHRQQGFARSCFHEGGPYCNKRHIQWQCSYKAFLYGEEILDNLHLIRFIFLFIKRTKIRFVILDIMLFSKTKWSLQEWKLGKGSVKQIGLFQVGRNFFLSLFSPSHLLITRYTERKWPKIDQHFPFYQSNRLSKEVHLLSKECIVPREPLCAPYDLLALGVFFFIWE